MPDKLTYEELKLGEKRKEMYLAGKSWDEINKESAFYLNTNHVIYGLNVTDLGIAAVLGKTTLLMAGCPGCGKTQMSYDFANYYFSGKGKGGNALVMNGKDRELDINRELFTELDLVNGKRVMSDKYKRPYLAMEEPNRLPDQMQNQFLDVMMGEIISPEGENVKLGKDGYSTIVSTANLGNGEYTGTSEKDDRALRDRFGVVIDFDYEMLKPTDEDMRFIPHLSEANPEPKPAPLRDISSLIIEANREISKRTLNKSLEEMAIMDFLKFGLKHCKGDGNKIPKGNKDSKWDIMYRKCQDCSNNADGKYLCSLIREIDGRTLSALPKYAKALEFLINLKNPKQEIDTTELWFKAFELTGAHQNFLNPFVLQQKYDSQPPKMMAEVVDRLKDDYNKKKDKILCTFESAKKGLDHRDTFYIKTPQGKKEIREGKKELEKVIDESDGTKTTIKEKLEEEGYKIDNLEIEEDNLGYSWVPESGDFIKIIANIKKEK